jgi:adenylate cyclase
METDINSPTMLTTCYTAVGDAENARRAAQVALGRAQKALALDQNNGGAMAYGANSLFVLGEAERAREWINRAMLVDPDNLNMRYNFACALSRRLGETDAALELLGPVFAKWDSGFLKHAKADPDLDGLRDDPRFQAMIATAEARLAENKT